MIEILMQVINVEMHQHPQLDMAQRMFDATKVQQTFTIEGQ
jgi:hypothetical protein